MKFTFEKSGQLFRGLQRRRDSAAAKAEADVLTHRLGLDKQQTLLAQEDVEAVLKRWGSDVALNLAWYASQLAMLEFLRRAGVVLVTLISLGALGALAYVTYKHPGGEGALFGAQAGFVLTAIFLALQLLSSVTDVKAQIGIFWETSANLKEAVYMLEERWAETSWDAARVIAFKIALREQISLARAETRRERTEYFKTLKSASDVVPAGMTALNQLRGKQHEVLDAYQALHPPAAPSTTAQSTADAARTMHERAVRQLEDAQFANQHAEAHQLQPVHSTGKVLSLLRTVDAAAAKLEDAHAQLFSL